jgi:N-dimethylarginine dimethylaminohydrolase
MDEQRTLIAPEMLYAHPETGPSSREKLMAQHRALRTLLAGNGVTLLEPLPQSPAPYQVFARDPSFAIGGTFFVASLRDPWRHVETNGLRELQTQFADVVSLSSSRSAIEGGDVFVLDARVLVGLNRNTDEAGVRALAATPALAEHEIVRVPHDALHLDCCVAPLPDGTALVALAKLPESSFRTLQGCFERLIPLNAEEAALHLAANLLWLDAARVVSNAAAVKTNALLRRRGFQVIELDYSELVALWGGIRCTVCPVERSTTS